jgi:outer membrane protein assembly factor BamB
VYISSGNDGVYALQADSGKVKWHFTADIHTDAKPCVHGNYVFVGTGPSRRYKTQQVVAINITDGKPLWRVPVDIPAWGSPNGSGNRLFVGLGNGRLMTSAQPPEKPAGALLCLNTRNGEELWRVKCDEAVFQQPTLHGENVYFASRDGKLKCVHQVTGSIVYEQFIGAPAIASPTISEDKIYTISVSGLLKASKLANGEELWRYDIAQETQTKPLCFGAVQVRDGKLYVAAELGTPAGNVPVVYCFEVQ